MYYFFFLSFGLTKVCPYGKRNRANNIEKLVEPEGSKKCRARIILLSSMIVLTWLAGADPHEISLFGIAPSGHRGVTVLGLAAIVAHLYWYVLRYQHLVEDGKIRLDPSISESEFMPLTNKATIVRKSMDLSLNRLAFGMAILAWGCLGEWLLFP